jgi:hypothetical protein
VAVTRRGALGAIFGGAVGGRRAVEAAVQNLGAEVMPATAPTWPMPPGNGISKEAIHQATAPILRALGVPQWVRDEWAQRAFHRSRSGLDEDLKVMKSLSRAAKRAIMYDRILREQEDRFWGNVTRQDMRESGDFWSDPWRRAIDRF